MKDLATTTNATENEKRSSLRSSLTEESTRTSVNDQQPLLPPQVVNSDNELPHVRPKSITWGTTDGGNSESDSHKQDSSDGDSTGKGTQEGRKYSRSIHHKLRRVSKRNTLSKKISTTSRVLQKCYRCCTPSLDSDSSNEYADLKPSKMKNMDKEEIIFRLQQAADEIGTHPTNYDIDSEILRWHRVLEMEHKQYENSGRPKFKYKWFRKNQYLAPKKHPLYGTNYENHRMLEVRLEEFRFGSTTAAHDKLKYAHQQSYESKDSSYWRRDSQVFHANFALLCCASNLFRFTQACYANGGFIFLITYCIMIAIVGQPLLYLEMVLGQYSLHGPSGFSMLHPYAKGIPYAIAFVCIVFGTSKSIYLAYCLLYSLISLVASPGFCGWWWSGQTKCVSYDLLEEKGQLLKEERAREKGAIAAHNFTSQNVHSAFSVELFFREVMLNTDWKSEVKENFVHWKIVVAYIVVCCSAMVPIHYNLSGRNMKRYLRWSSRVIPGIMTIIFLHQIFIRGGMSLATRYFLAIDSKHVSALTLWSEAFEMVLSTLGIGYGFHWSISGNISIDYRNTYRLSWRVCGYAVFFGMLSSLVLFCEIGFVGEFTGDESSYDVFYEHLGIPFVCFSGAFLKLGGNSVFFIFLCFLLIFMYGMWSQINVCNVILRWIEHGFIIKGTRTLQTVQRKKSTLVFLIVLQLFLISPHCLSKRGAVLASENIFGGSFAALVVLLAELVIVNYLYGFARFNADLEIMTKRSTPYTFQFQIRYLAIPTILIFMIPMILNVYIYPSIYLDRNNLDWLFYFGLSANFSPVIITLLGIKYDFSSILRCNSPVNKVVPHFFHGGHTENYGTVMEEVRKRYPLVEPKFVAKENAPSQQSQGRNIRSEIYHVVEYNTSFVHKCQDYVKTKFLELIKFKVNQARWIRLSFATLRKKPVKSMPALVSRIMLARKYRNDRMDIRFLNAALEQIVNLTFASAIRKLQRMPVQEMLLYLANELLKLTTFRANDTKPYKVTTLSSSSSSSESSTSDEEHNNNGSSSSFSSSENLLIGEDADNAKRCLEIHQKLIGQVYRNSEESRALLTIRLKRGLGLPHVAEISVLKYLRRARAKQERELSCWTQRDDMPVDHFIPSSIRNPQKQKICFTIFHAVVIEGNDHFVLKKLPVPKPPIVRVTKDFVNSQPGKTLTDKLVNIVTKRMHRNIGRILARKRDLRQMSKKKLRRHFWKVSDRVDDDIYDFLDRILTCVIVIIPEWEAKEKVMGRRKKMYLTPRARRKSPQYGRSAGRRLAITDYDIQSYGALNYKQRQENYWSKLLEQSIPPDLRYHRDSSDSDEDPIHMKDEDDMISNVYSSSGSSSTLSSDDMEEETPSAVEMNQERSPHSSLSSLSAVSSLDSAAVRVPTRTNLSFRGRSSKSVQYLTTNETLQHRDKRMLLRKSGFGIPGLEERDSELAVCVSVEKIKHISARRWKHDHDRQERQNNKKVKFTEKEIKLQQDVDEVASLVAVQAVASKSMSELQIKKGKKSEKLVKAVSLESIRHFVDSDAKFTVDFNRGAIVAISKDKLDARTQSAEGKLKNVNPELMYLGYGKTLIVDHHGVKLQLIPKTTGQRTTPATTG